MCQQTHCHPALLYAEYLNSQNPTDSKFCHYHLKNRDPVPKFQQIFDDLQVRNLPVLTQVILSTPRAVYAFFCLALIAMLVWKESRITSRTRTLVTNIAAFIVANVLLAVIVYAMFAPVIGIQNSLNGLQTNAPPAAGGLR